MQVVNQLNVCWKQLFFCFMAGPSSMISRPSIGGCQVQQREIKVLFRKVNMVNWFILLSQSLKFNFFLFLSGLYFIWQVYTASPIFGVEFETEEKVNTKLIQLYQNSFGIFLRVTTPHVINEWWWILIVNINTPHVFLSFISNHFTLIHPW